MIKEKKRGVFAHLFENATGSFKSSGKGPLSMTVSRHSKSFLENPTHMAPPPSLMVKGYLESFLLAMDHEMDPLQNQRTDLKDSEQHVPQSESHNDRNAHEAWVPNPKEVQVLDLTRLQTLFSKK